tara:strand:+ start:496 stop:684 length:189 start_codon:yes stop_codon:yes gene_type:complete
MFLIRFEIIAFSDFLSDIKKPLLIKKIGYAGNMKADIFKYLVPNSITFGLLENILTILSADK